MFTQNRITHINIVVDASYSMQRHAAELIKVVDGLIRHLAGRTQPDEEIRISVYDFADDTRNLIYEKDVLRLPSIAQLYRPRGNTALIDATILSLDELAQTAQLHGDHAFLTFVLTDGEDNRSRRQARDLRAKLDGLPKDWTVACLVPNAYGKHEAQNFGFAPGNIAIWSPENINGMEEAGSVIRTAADDFMTGRVRGVRGTNALFSTGVDAVNAATVQATLAPLSPDTYEIVPVGTDAYIELFIRSTGRPFVKGQAFYQLTKRELIQRTKKIAIREKNGAKRVFTGPQARDLLGLRDADERVKPDDNPDYSIYVQSTSTNRKLISGTDLLLIR
jgi:hypothetical protein